MSRQLDSVFTRDESLAPHYEEKLRAILSKVWRNKLLVVATVTAALMIGIAIALLMPKSYTAEAYIREGFATKAISDPSGGATVSVDASVLVETRSRLLRSRQLARAVVQRLGLVRILPAVGKSTFESWFLSTFYGDPSPVPQYETDLAAERLLNDLAVTTEPRVYGIVVRYSDRDPELATLITNGFVVEFREAIRRQSLSQQREAAERVLSERLTTLGEKHPKVREAKARLETEYAHLSEKTTNKENYSLTELAEIVRSSPNPVVCIGVALFVGLTGGILMAAFRPIPRAPK